MIIDYITISTKFTAMISKKMLMLSVAALLLWSCGNEEDETPPGQVTDLAAEIGNEQVTLDWSDPTDPDFDRVEITFSPGGSNPEIVSKGAESEVITGLTNGTEYTFSVVSIDTENNRSGAATVSATPAPPLQVNTPNPASYSTWTDFSYNSGIVSVTIVFSNEIDKNSIVVGETVILSTTANSNVPGNITWNDNQTMTFTTNQTVVNWCNFTPDCFFTFTLVGNDTGNGQILDTFGQSLAEDIEFSFGILG